MTALWLRAAARSRQIVAAMKTRGERARMGGMSVLELVAAVGITTFAAGLAGGALGAMGRAVSVQSGRVRVMTALLEARRRAYGAETTIEVAGRTGDHAVTIHLPVGEEIRRELPAGTELARSPASGRVRFFASGLADNATFAVGATGGGAGEERIVVNQRGLVR
jgi:hypothetical protein